jgi:Holliday junction DNA helicase RuvA
VIARLRGTVLELGGGRLVVDCGGVGYEVSVPESVLVHAREDGHIELFTRQTFREDDVSLYGFSSREQRRMFDMLRDVKGCGAKISLSLLSTLGEQDIVAAIAAQDAKTLARAPGVGVRMAERIIVELKDKSQELSLQVTTRGATVKAPPADELTEALMNLGYRRGEVDAVIDAVKAEAHELEDQIKAALKRLMR